MFVQSQKIRDAQSSYGFRNRKWGGDNKGPSALEVAIMSLADCAITIFADVCKQSNVELSKMEVEAEAEKPVGSTIISGVNMKEKISRESEKTKT